MIRQQYEQSRASEEARRRAETEELKAQVALAQADCAQLRHELDSSLALRAARSLQWILGPIRKIMGGKSGGGAP